MELIVRKAFLSVAFGVIFSVGALTSGCSSDQSPPVNADGGKKDGGTGGKGGSGGSGGSSGSGGATGSGGSSAKGGSTGSGGSSAKGGAGGSSSAGGAGGGAGGTAGSGAGGSGAGGTGGKTSLDGGSGDVGKADATPGDDAVDAPLPGDDGAVLPDTAQVDVGAVILDSGSVDTEGVDVTAVDTVVLLLDAEIDTAAADVGADLGSDRAADGPACLSQLVSNGYASGTAEPCSACKDGTLNPPTNLETQCKGMIDCLEAASCTSQTSPNNCWINCRNGVTGNQPATEACVIPLVAAACP